jgi:bacteriocin biosynthesis cyclodehydratase domain-containing protein
MIPVGDAQVVLKRGVKELLISGEDVQAIAQPLVAELENGRGVGDLLQALAPERQAGALAMLEALAAREMLSDGEAVADTPEARFFANFGSMPGDAAAALAAAHVVVHGVGLISRSLVAALAEVGTGRVTLVDDPALRDDTDAALEEAERRRVDVVTEATAVPAAADLVVATSDTGREGALLALSRHALRQPVRFLPAWLANMTGYVGPLTHPFETACLRCYQLRVDANDPQREARRAVRGRVADDADAGDPGGYLAPMASVVGQIAAIEVAKELGGFAPVDAVGRSVEINLVSFRSAVRRVFKLPRCPDCGEPGRQASRTIFRGIQIAE